MTALTATRLTFRLHRFELLAFVILVVFGFGLADVVAGRLDALHFDPRCYDPTAELEPSAACADGLNRFYAIVNNEATKVRWLTTFVPYLAGLLLGVPVVGRELERGTARLAWSITPSRQTWFRHRFVPLLIAVAGGSWLLGIAADRLLAAASPGFDPANSFEQFGSRGVVIAARATFVFALAVLVGAAMGRVLPAVILAGVLAIVGITGGSMVHQRILETEAVPLENPGPGDLWLTQRFRLPDGRLIGYDELERYDPMPTDPEFAGTWPTLPQVNLGIPGSRYREVELREVGALLGGTLVALVATAAIVQRRRPA